MKYFLYCYYYKSLLLDSASAISTLGCADIFTRFECALASLHSLPSAFYNFLGHYILLIENKNIKI